MHTCMYMYMYNMYMYAYTNIKYTYILTLFPCFHICACTLCDYMYLSDHIYIYIYIYSSCLLQYSNIFNFVSQCMFSHALYYEVLNLPYRSFFLFDL